ncbi:mechanosensitive ion channel family protein [Limnoglobus roseus]|uniref:MscS Mechanosensitive ion channel n=1 Tax=Limnoglobus roseus TaxID=2598579 RepID=A0A5C1AGH8_9BACT|nr:mechanosensitive ion channel domain-containing protein [Limnoglobus roseus]QEL17745.1 MscS Mechanosensitive ion channel [Limnoglobus roseus]
MGEFLRTEGPQRAVYLFDVRLVGVNADNGKKVLFTVAFVVLLLLLAWALRRVAAALLKGNENARTAFWTRQGINLFGGAFLLFGIASIWFDDPTTLTTALGLVSAGLAFALQKVVTAIAGYFVILRRKTFNVGNRIAMGGVRGDVLPSGSCRRPSWKWASRRPSRGPTRLRGCRGIGRGR